MRLFTTWCIFAALGCGSGQNDPGAAVACDTLDPGLGRALLSTSEPRKTGAWSDEMSSRVEAALRGECERTRWTRASYACLQGGVCDADATRQRDRARALAEATIHELDAAIAKGADSARPGAIGSPLPSASTDPDYPTPAAAGTDKIFSTEDPDRGPKVPVDYALPPKAELTWSDHAYCEDDRTNIVCSPDPAPKGQLWSWRLGKRGKELVVAESWRAGHLVQTFVYVLGRTGTADHRMWIDGYGRVVDALLFDPDRFTGRKINGGNALEGCGGMTYKTGASGHLDEVACMQWGSNDAMRDLERTVTSRYVRDPMGFIVEQRRLGLDGKPISKNDGVPHTVVERDAQGRIVVERYRDEADAPMAAKSGCYGERTERDATGTTTTVTCLAADDRPMNRHRGTAFDRAEHDRAGCTTRLVHDKADGSPGADVDRVHAERYVVDDHCANLKRDCFDTDDRGTACGQGEPARYVSVYDAFGQVTTARHYDSHGNPSQDAVYAAFELRKTWDGVGNNLSQSCFDVAGKRALCGATGFAGDVSTYDDAGRRIEVRFIDTDGKPGKNLGATARKIRYDNYDHVFETRQVDERGEPFVLLGQTIRRDLYDVLHRHFAILLLDVAGKPARYAGCYQGIACPTAPWHAMRILRRADGTPEFNVYFDATGHETQRFDCSTSRCFDE